MFEKKELKSLLSMDAQVHDLREVLVVQLETSGQAVDSQMYSVKLSGRIIYIREAAVKEVI